MPVYSATGFGIDNTLFPYLGRSTGSKPVPANPYFAAANTNNHEWAGRKKIAFHHTSEIVYSYNNTGGSNEADNNATASDHFIQRKSQRIQLFADMLNKDMDYQLPDGWNNSVSENITEAHDRKLIGSLLNQRDWSVAFHQFHPLYYSPQTPKRYLTQQE